MRFALMSFLIAFLMVGNARAQKSAISRTDTRPGARSLEQWVESLAKRVELDLRAMELSNQARGTAAPTANELLPNGGFESGSTVWSEFSAQGWDLILDTASLPAPILPYSGNWAVWLGGDQNEFAYIDQQVTVPSGSPTLNYWHWIDSEDACGFDFARVFVNSSEVDEYDLCFQTDTGNWVLYSLDMSAFAGQTVSLRIRVETDDQLLSSLFVDEVYWEYTSANEIFSDGFESGDTSAWADATP